MPDDDVEAKNILEIDYKNPPFNRTDDWAKAIAGKQFPFADYEWTQVLAPQEEYDYDLVGATGWMINPHHSHADFPCTHPFIDASSDPMPPNLPPITDWEFHLALDRDTTNPRKDYQFLLAAGNSDAAHDSDEDLVRNARDVLHLDVPCGLLGVEIDGGLVPRGFKTGAKTGDRVAVFGRWIVDTAHPSSSGSFRSEIHPPLVMARASVQPLASAQLGTRVLFTSRPYLVGQKLTEDTNNIYNDSAGHDLPTLRHFAEQFAKIHIPITDQFKAYPKIKSYPFRGVHLLHIQVRPPAFEAGGRGVGGMRPRLAVSFQFRVRSGCAVQVSSSSDDTVDVLISLSDAGYTPPPLPRRRSKSWKREEFDAMRRGIGLDILLGEAGGAVLEALSGVNFIETAVALMILERGIKIDLYDPLPGVDINDARQAVTRAWANEVSPGAGIVRDNAQPFPILGWLEATWQLSGGIPL